MIKLFNKVGMLNVIVGSWEGHYGGVHDKNIQFSSMFEMFHEAEKITRAQVWNARGERALATQTIRPTSWRAYS